MQIDLGCSAANARPSLSSTRLTFQGIVSRGTTNCKLLILAGHRNSSVCEAGEAWSFRVLPFSWHRGSLLPVHSFDLRGLIAWRFQKANRGLFNVSELTIVDLAAGLHSGEAARKNQRWCKDSGQMGPHIKQNWDWEVLAGLPSGFASG